MILFNVLKERLVDLGVYEKLEPFYSALHNMKETEVIQEISNACDNNYFKIHYAGSTDADRYEVGDIIIEFDEESPLYEYTYTINLSYVSQYNTYLPKIQIEKNRLLIVKVCAN